MSYCALDEAHGKNKDAQIFTVFISVVKGLKWDSYKSDKQGRELHCMNPNVSCNSLPATISIPRLVAYLWQGGHAFYKRDITVEFCFYFCVNCQFKYIAQIKKNKETGTPAPKRFLWNDATHFCKETKFKQFLKINANISINNSKCGNIGSYAL